MTMNTSTIPQKESPVTEKLITEIQKCFNFWPDLFKSHDITPQTHCIYLNDTQALKLPPVPLEYQEAVRQTPMVEIGKAIVVLTCSELFKGAVV